MPIESALMALFYWQSNFSAQQMVGRTIDFACDDPNSAYLRNYFRLVTAEAVSRQIALALKTFKISANKLHTYRSISDKPAKNSYTANVFRQSNLALLNKAL
jgi:hypothetical protein